MEKFTFLQVYFLQLISKWLIVYYTVENDPV